jgi:hypothetical protein
MNKMTKQEIEQQVTEWRRLRDQVIESAPTLDDPLMAFIEASSVLVGTLSGLTWAMDGQGRRGAMATLKREDTDGA